MNDKRFDVLKSATEAYFDALVELGAEYKEIYEKQSDFAKTVFFGKIASVVEKGNYNEIFEVANEIEQEYLGNHTETN